VSQELEWLTELWWADPPGQVNSRIHEEARSSVRWSGGRKVDTLESQSHRRKVLAEFMRRLNIYGIYVEGADHGDAT
jgi:hypothetical protein